MPVYNDLMLNDQDCIRFHISHIILSICCDYYQYNSLSNKGKLILPNNLAFETFCETVKVSDDAVTIARQKMRTSMDFDKNVTTVTEIIRHHLNQDMIRELNDMLFKMHSEGMYLTYECKFWKSKIKKNNKNNADIDNNKNSKPKYNVYMLSISYCIRVLWRLSAVTSRFVLFSLIWVVMGGGFLVIIGPSMILIWYLILLFYINMQCTKEMQQKFCKCVAIHELGKTVVELMDEFDVDSGCIGYCCMFCCAPLVFIIGFCMAGITFQLGVLGIAGRFMYILRMFENVALMSVITLFAFDKSIDCNYCADPDLRSATYNDRIEIWLIVGWVSIIVHIFSSFVVSVLIDQTYDFNFKTLLEKEMKRRKEAWVKQQVLAAHAQMQAGIPPASPDSIAMEQVDVFNTDQPGMV